MLASFFYQGDPPTAETLLDMAREALVATANDTLDSAWCEGMVEGLVTAWTAARAHERGDEDDAEEPCFETGSEAEHAYMKRGLRVYVKRVKQAFPDYEPSDDGVIWWPEGMKVRRGWPKAFVAAIAVTLGEIEGDRSVATFKYMQQRQEAERAEGTA
jgi:hypothetical protein